MRSQNTAKQDASPFPSLLRFDFLNYSSLDMFNMSLYFLQLSFFSHQSLFIYKLFVTSLFIIYFKFLVNVVFVKTTILITKNINGHYQLMWKKIKVVYKNAHIYTYEHLGS